MFGGESFTTSVKKLLRLPWVKIRATEYDYVYGSRKVIKDPNNPNQQHYYSVDLWTSEGSKYAPLIPRNTILYGELIGWVPGTETPIQKGYTYQVPVGECHLWVYRVSVVTEDGGQYDLGDKAMREFCGQRGLNVVPKLWEGYKPWFQPEVWLDQKFRWEYDLCGAEESDILSEPVPLAKESPVDEGVVIRVEGVIPTMFKLKGNAFYAYETRVLDSGEADLETEGSSE